MFNMKKTWTASLLVSAAVAIPSTALAQLHGSPGGHTPAPRHSVAPRPMPTPVRHPVVPRPVVPATRPTTPPIKPMPKPGPKMGELMPYKTTPRGVPIPPSTPPSLRPQAPAAPTPPPLVSKDRYIVPDPDNQRLHFGTPVGKGRVDGNVHPQGGEVQVTVPVGK